MRKSWLVYYVIIVFKPKILFFLLNEMENFNQIIKKTHLICFSSVSCKLFYQLLIVYFKILTVEGGKF